MPVYKLEKILTEIRLRRRNLADKMATTTAGYSAPYALAVHENLTARFTVGQAKFLEQSMRTEKNEMAKIVRSRLRAGLSLKEAQVQAFNHLMKVSLQLTPMKTGRLRSSWFII